MISKYRCPECGGATSISCDDAVVRWMPLKNEWELVELCLREDPTLYCKECDVEAPIEEFTSVFRWYDRKELSRAKAHAKNGGEVSVLVSGFRVLPGGDVEHVENPEDAHGWTTYVKLDSETADEPFDTVLESDSNVRAFAGELAEDLAEYLLGNKHLWKEY